MEMKEREIIGGGTFSWVSFKRSSVDLYGLGAKKKEWEEGFLIYSRRFEFNAT